MNRRIEPLRVTFTLSPDSVRSLFDLIAEAAGSDSESRRAARRMESSKKAVFAGEEPPWDGNLMVSKRQASELLQISTRTIDNLKREGRMPHPIRIGRAVRWNRAELVAWVDAGCPDCNEWKYSPEGTKQN